MRQRMEWRADSLRVKHGQDSKGLARWRGLVRVTPETFWMRETTTEGRFAEIFLRPAVFPD